MFDSRERNTETTGRFGSVRTFAAAIRGISIPLLACTWALFLFDGVVAQDDGLGLPAVESALGESDDIVSPAASESVVPSEIEARLNALQAEVNDLRQAQTIAGETPPVAAAETKYPTIKLTGFFQADAGWIEQSDNSLATFGDIEDVAGFRRARLAAFGQVVENVSYRLEMDFGFPGRPNFTDVWFDVHDVPVLGNVKVGQWKQPFLMDAVGSIRELVFFERPLSFAFIPFRQIGVGFHDTNAAQTMTWAASGFRFPSDPWGNIGSPFGIGDLGDRGYGMAGRMTAVFLEKTAECGGLVHVGADYGYIAPGGHAHVYRNTPEFGGPFVGPSGNASSMPFFVDTGVFPADNINLFNVELGARYGSLYGQSEITYAVAEDPGGNSMRFPGAYTQVAYLLTGEERAYNQNLGAFGRVKPRCDFGKSGWGAWEAAVRYSYLDLNGRSIAGPIVPGGRLSDITYGLNWYLNQFTKVQFNFIQAMLDRPAEGHSVTNIYAVRAQLDF